MKLCNPSNVAVRCASHSQFALSGATPKLCILCAHSTEANKTGGRPSTRFDCMRYYVWMMAYTQAAWDPFIIPMITKQIKMENQRTKKIVHECLVIRIDPMQINSLETNIRVTFMAVCV